MTDLIKKYGLSTYHGTNTIAFALVVMEIGREFPVEVQKWFQPLMMGLLALIFFLIRGNTAPDIANTLNGIGHEDIKDVLKEGRE